MLHVANGAKPYILLQTQTYWDTQWCGLFVNNIVPDDDTVLTDLTECSDSGYAADGRQHPSFGGAILNGDNQGEMEADEITWTFSLAGGNFTVYGYFFASLSSSGSLIIVERAATPFAVTAAGQTYTVKPKILLDTLS